MNTFNSLKQRTKLLIVVSGLFLLTFSLGFLVFGHNSLGLESHLIHEASEGVKADLFYSHPGLGDLGEH